MSPIFLKLCIASKLPAVFVTDIGMLVHNDLIIFGRVDLALDWLFPQVNSF